MGELRYIIYVRKSTDTEDRQVRSVDDQLAELRDVARHDNLRIIDTLIERRSAKTPGRPLFGQMLDLIEAGTADAILSWDVDRVARNAVDSGRLMDLMDRDRLVELRTASHRYHNAPYDKFMLGIALGQSKLYSDNLAVGVRRAQRRMVREGRWPARAPFGYRFDRRARLLAIDENEAAVVRTIFSSYATGDVSAATICQRLTDAGILGRRRGRFTTQRVLSILRHPIYCGLIRWKGELSSGIHPPLVPVDRFDQVQRMLARTRTPKLRLIPFRYRRLFRCSECGCTITCELQKGHTYLRCTKRRGPCDQSYVRQEAVDAQICAAVATYGIDAALADQVLHDLTAARGAIAAARDRDLSTLRQRLAALDAQLERLLNALLAQLITNGEYVSRKNALVEERHRLEHAITTAGQEADGWFEPARELIRALNRATDLGRGENMAETAAFFENIGSNHRIQYGRVLWEPTGFWKSLAPQGFGGTQPVLGGSGGASPRRPLSRREILCALTGAVRAPEPVLEWCPIAPLALS